MFTEARVSSSSALVWGLAPEPRRMMVRAATPRRLTRSDTPELAPTLTRDVVRFFAIGAIGVNLALAFIDITRLAFLAAPPRAILVATIAGAIAIPLHIRHIIFGMRGERPPYGRWTLAALASVNAVAAILVGPTWIFQFASLAVSTLIVLPGAVGLGLAAIVVASPLVLQGTQWFFEPHTLGGIYLVFAIVWRSVTQFVPLWLMAAIHALDITGRELELRAVVHARLRIDAELRDGVAATLEQIVARGETALRTATTDPARTSAELRELVGDSRRALMHARRVVAGYRGATVRAELDAAVALLEASGARVTVEVADGLTLDVPDHPGRTAIRSAVARVLRDEPNASYRLVVSSDDDGTISIAVSTVQGVATTASSGRAR